MKAVKIVIKNGEVHLDFSGFSGRTCEDEENTFRALCGKMGVKTDVEFSDNKREAEAIGIAESARSGS